MNFTVTHENENATVSLSEFWEGSVAFLRVDMQCQSPLSPKPVTIDFSFDCVDIYSVFSPSVDLDIALAYDWAKTSSVSRICIGSPIHAMLSLNGENRLTVAIADGVTPVRISSGVREEDARMAVRITLFDKPTGVFSSYSTAIRLDFTKKEYFKVLADVTAWQKENYLPAYAPACAYEPVFSTWYCYHQNVDAADILRECAYAHELGLKTVIVDDGWQTDDLQRGYAYCGDWNVATKKIHDMKKFVNGLHEIGMKVLFWFALPYVGSKSQAFAALKEYVLEDLEENFEGQATLDPRFPIVREYIQNKIVDFFTTYDLDGLKLDFIEAFSTPSQKGVNPKWDVLSVEEGVELLLKGIYEKMTAVKPDVMLEFRQPYLSPATRQYGNMIRVADCPDDMMKNRFYSVNMRLILDGTAVHSDMLLWNENESDEAVFRQLCSTLFAVPQISMKISKLSPSHKKVLTAFLNYHKENQDILTKSPLEAYRPESHYTQIFASNKNKRICLAYLSTPITLGEEPQTDILNCTSSDTLLLQAKTGEYEVEIKDVYGEVISKNNLSFANGYEVIKVPTECYIQIKRVR